MFKYQLGWQGNSNLCYYCQMLNHLFIDSLNALSSELETNTLHLLTHSRKPSEKVESLAMELTNFKCEVLKNVAKFIKGMQAKGSRGESQIVQTLAELDKEISMNSEKLFRYRLHHILKNKAAKRRKQSMMISSYSEDQQLNDLERSIILIQKDLGIQQESQDNQQLAITKMINRSLFLGIDSTPISNIKTDYSIISQNGSVRFQLGSKDFSQDMNASLAHQPEQDNSKVLEQLPRSTPTAKKTLPLKKKKVIMSKTDARQGLLGNLLEQTYKQFDKK